MDEGQRPGASELSRIQFLDNEIDLCQTFLDVARVDADDPPAARTATSKARKGYETALAWVGSIRSVEERNRLTARLIELQTRLDSLNFHDGK